MAATVEAIAVTIEVTVAVTAAAVTMAVTTEEVMGEVMGEAMAEVMAEVIAVAMAEAMVEETVKVTVEVTAEATAKATAEATAEATVEAAVEVGPEVKVEVVAEIMAVTYLESHSDLVNIMVGDGGDAMIWESDSFDNPGQKHSGNNAYNGWRWERSQLVLDVHPNSTEQICGLSCEFENVQIMCVHRRLVTSNVWGGNLSPAFNADETKRMLIMLQRRYDLSNKELNISSVATDPDLGTVYSRNKAAFFSELMQIWQNSKETTPLKIDLSRNTLTSLDTIPTFAQTFPDLKNLTLAHNSFMTTEILSPWGWELRELEQLDLTGNPFVTRVPAWKDDILRSYLRLTHLNGDQVRTPDDALVAREHVLSIPPLAPVSQGNTNAEIFLKRFFPNYDQDRSSLAGQYYDADSTFSIIIDQRGRLAPGYPPATWENYSRKQNIIKLNFSPPPRRLESVKGPQKIRECWNALPRTIHPDVDSELFRYMYEEEEYVLEGVVRAYIIMIRGEFQEVIHPIRNTTVLRSFDRTFLVEPIQSYYQFRIISDILVISPYAGDFRDLPSNTRPASYEQTIIGPYMAPAKNYAATLHIPPDFGEHRVGKPSIVVEREILALELSRRKRLTLEASGEILDLCTWLYSDAIKYIEQKGVNLRHS
ncbi:hypothetical protein MMC27_008145 [Xylographa pallens]|nr:hypothetical protein [Xylographa pallens]